MSCQPSYTYRPTERPPPAQSSAPGFTEHRSRLFAGGTFFRSIEQGQDQNDISLEAVIFGGEITFNISVLGTIEETFVVPQTFTTPIPPATEGSCSGGISGLRAAINDPVDGSSLIEMPTRGFDFFDSGTDPTTNCLSSFSTTSMTGGSGPPSNPSQAFLDSIFTGPERTLIIIDTTEDNSGFPVTPGPSKRIQQFDGIEFISYCNLVPGQCPLEGTC